MENENIEPMITASKYIAVRILNTQYRLSKICQRPFFVDELLSDNLSSSVEMSDEKLSGVGLPGE